ncbi:MAG: protein kinase [Oscillospiraceae bacterium]|nr:protein kinase [Oscillospiraceae bacterium]
MLEINAVLDGRYKILDIIGKGGTSCVYLAEDSRLKNHCALKDVYKNSSGLVGTHGGLITEAAMLIRLRHTGLPVIHDIFENDNSYFLVMEYIEGSPLNKILEQSGAQPEADVIRWGRQLCGVLQYLHTRQPAIIYRDMKPANIMLKPDGEVTLIDFGTAREYKTAGAGDTAYLGTHGYAAPEQYGSEGQTDARTDVYCLGVTLYHLVTGQDPRLPPYRIQPIREIDPSLSKKLERVLQKCTQPDPEDRYQSAAELLRELGKIQPKEDGIRVPERVIQEENTAPVEEIPAEIETEDLPAEETRPLVEEQETEILLATEPQRKKKMIGLISAVCLMVVVLTGSLLVFLLNASGNKPETESTGESASAAAVDDKEPEVTVTVAGTYGTITGVESDTETVLKNTTETTKPVEIAVSAANPVGTTIQSAAIHLAANPDQYDQKVIVASVGTNATVKLYEWDTADCVERFSTSNARVGKQGVGVSYGERKDMTPKGQFNLGFCFGVNTPNTKLKFIEITQNTVFVDDVNSEYYNTIVDKSILPSNIHHEETYKYFAIQKYYSTCIFIEFNGDGLSKGSAIPGRGSVITLCGINGNLNPTFGDVAISSTDMIALLSYLDISKNPVIIIE